MVKVYPGKNWIRRFLSRHAEIIVAKPRGLDPKRAQNFNKATITEYFDMRKTMDEKYDGIPPEHNWNVDEKGCQMGGGRKGDNSKFIFSKTTENAIVSTVIILKELVTIIERFSALYGSKRRTGRPVAIANPTSSESSTPSASTSLPTAANNMHPQPPFFLQMQGSLSHHVGPAPVVSTSSQPLLSGHPNSHSLYYSGNLQYIFN